MLVACPNYGTPVEDFKLCPNLAQVLPRTSPAGVALSTGPPPPAYKPAPTIRKSSRTPLLALLVIVVILGALFGYYYLQSSSSISSLNQTVTSQSSQISAQAAQIAADNTKITNLTSIVSSLQSRISSLQSQVTVDEAKVNSLTTKDVQANQTISSLDSQIASLNSQISSYQSQVTALNNQISSLQTQVFSLQAIGNLSRSTMEVASKTFTIPSSSSPANVQVVSFTATYAGYVSVTASIATDSANDGMRIENVYAGSIDAYFNDYFIPPQGSFYTFTTVPVTLVFPVIPGTVNVFFVTADATAQSATLTVVYHY